MLNSVAGEGVSVAGINKTDEKIPETDKHSETDTDTEVDICGLDTDVDICGIDEEQPDDEVSLTPMDAEGTESDVEEPAAENPKDSKTSSSRKRKKQLIGEDVCFICFDGGELFLCDRQGCNKGYHPSCVNRDEAFFRAKGVWTCGWHLCSICEKTAYYKCYTCPFSLCKGCVKDGVILCVRRNKGFCESCIEVVKLIENIGQGDKKVEVDFDDTSSWEFLFKDYWVELKENLSISHEEIALAKNPYIEKTANQHDVDSFASSSDSDTMLTRLSKKRKSKKLLKSHFPIEAETEANEDIHKEKKQKFRKKSNARGPQSKLNDYAAIDSHNINLIYLRRKLMEDLLEDSDRFHDTVVGTFVRIRISASNQKQDVYRLVQVVGTMKVDEPYRIEKKNCDILLEILNLHKTEITPINSISNQSFTEDECDRLRQSIKCGLIRRLTVGEILDKALALQHTLVTDWLETEIVRLSHLRDRASEKGRKKELREFVEKLQVLKTPAERLRRLQQIPEIHADPNMHPSYKSVDDGDETDTDDNRKEGNNRFVGKERNPVIARKSESFRKDFCSRPRKSSDTNSEPKQPRSDIKSEPSIRMLSKSQPQSRNIKKSTSQPAVKSEPRKYSDANSEPKQPTSDMKSEPSTGILSESQLQSSVMKKSTSQPAVKSEPRKYSDANSKPKQPTSDIKSEPRKNSDANSKPKQPISDIKSEPRKNSDANSKPKQPTSDIKSEPSTSLFSESQPQSSIIKKSTSQPTMKSEPRKDTDANSEPKQQTLDIKSQPSTEILAESQPQSSITEKSNLPAGKSEPAVKPEKIWHYEDPSKKIQGPFSMTQLRRWSDKSLFPASLRIWKKSEAQSESILLTDALAGKFEKNNSAVLSKAEVSDLVDKNNLLKKQACGSPKPALAETPPPPLPENVNAGLFSRGVEGNVEYDDRDRLSSPGNKAGNSRSGLRKVCPYNQNGECKKGASCGYLHN
jgi:hypothetical protein